jgi:hypothetical protein
MIEIIKIQGRSCKGGDRLIEKSLEIDLLRYLLHSQTGGRI